MKREDSYQINKIATNFNREVNRLEGQLDLFWEKELAFYRDRGLCDGMTVLDCGCGPGHMIYRLSRQFKNAEIKGIEIDQPLVQYARDLIGANGVENCEVFQGSILDTGLEAEKFDFIISRLVLEHLPNPKEAVKEVRRILKPGGTVVFVANDFAFHLRTHPEIAELDNLYDAYCRCRIDEGGNPFIGRELPRLLSDCGFGSVTLEIIGAHNSIIGDDAFLKSEGAGIAAQLIKDGYLDKSVFDRMVSKWRDMIKNDHHSIFRQLFYCSGIKGDTSGFPGLKDEKQHNRGKIAGNEGKKPEKPGQDNNKTTQEAIEEYIAQLIATTLEVDPAVVKQGVSLDEIGLDSIRAANMQAIIESDLGIELQIADFFNEQNAQSLSRMAMDKLKSSPGVIAYPHENPDLIEKQSAVDVEETKWEEGEI